MGRRRRRSAGDEINLTPLLDVLFSILFIALLTSTQSEKLLQADAQETQAQVEVLTSRVDELEAAAESARIYEENAVIVTLLNDIEDGNHVLRVCEGREAEVQETVRMGADRPQYTRSRLRAIIEAYVEGAPDQPVYVVFRCRPDRIYRTEEFLPIQEELQSLRRRHKEVFYEITEVDR